MDEMIRISRETGVQTLLLRAIFAVSALCALASSAPSGKKSNHNKFVPDFVRQRVLADGEVEQLVRSGAITALETSAFEGGQRRPDSGLRFVEITDGRHFVQVIYDAHFGIRDCEYIRDKNSVRDFLNRFAGDFAAARKAYVDGFVDAVNSDDVSGGDLKREAKFENGTVRLLGEGEKLPEHASKLVDYSWHREECRQLHHKIKLARKNASKNQTAESEDSDVTDNPTRTKRDLLIYPGTNWCGVGSKYDRYNDLGWSASADRCCRQHDKCPHVITGFTSMYHLFNYRYHSISHCECDERFRTCLKKVNNAPSNMVGKLFFNIVQMKCFILKPEQVCIKRSWWGKCLATEEQLTAHIREVLDY